MFQDTALKPLLTEESYTLHGKEAQHFFVNKLYTAARRGDKFRELVQDVFENVRSTICVGWDAAQKATHYLPMSTVLAGRPIDFQVAQRGQPVWVQWAAVWAQRGERLGEPGYRWFQKNRKCVTKWANIYPLALYFPPQHSHPCAACDAVAPVAVCRCGEPQPA